MATTASGAAVAGTAGAGSSLGRLALGVSGGLALMGCVLVPAYVLLPYPLFVLVYLTGWRLKLIRPPAAHLLVATLLCATVLETGAWLDAFTTNDPSPELFHPQLIPDLIMGLGGVYSAWWLSWWLALRRFLFTPKQVFLAAAVYGVLIEQQGRVFLAGLRTFPVGLVLWLFVALAYGSTMASTFCLARDSNTGRRNSRWKFLWALGAMLVFTVATSLVWGWILDTTHILPPKHLPIRESPFW